MLVTATITASAIEAKGTLTPAENLCAVDDGPTVDSKDTPTPACHYYYHQHYVGRICVWLPFGYKLCREEYGPIHGHCMET